ncbi:facilitated trehalose transporter Tret1-like [Lycorma delicatula]|uniref:facilitated trehalose transporter Tret1-like n=1 Tax=Lycorma delicatula TaxID=130591 RepID=UPI003F50DB53
MLINIFSCLQNQYISAFSVGLTVMVSGACFAWVSPVLPLLTGPDAIIPMDSTQLSWMISLIELGSLFSPPLAGFIANLCGRKPGILIAGPPMIAGWVLILMTRDVYSLYVVRLLHGFSVGVLFTIVPIYLGEIAAVNVRGGITSLLQTMWYTGFLYQYVIGSYLSYKNSVIVNLCLTTAVFIFFFLIQPETPTYFVIKKREEDANKSLMLLRGKSTITDIATEMQNIKDSVTKDTSNKTKLSDLINLSKTDFRIILTVQVLSTIRLLSGTITYSAYINEILRKADWEKVSPKVIMMVYSSITLITICIATLSIDYFGRRPLLLLSCIGTGICNFALGFIYWCKATGSIIIDTHSIRWFPALALNMFTMFFGIGLGPVTQTLQSELFPTHLRAIGNILTAYNLVIISFLSLRFYQIIIDLIDVYANFFIFSANCLLGAIITYVYVPETKGKTFLEINEFFHKKSNKDKTKNLEITRV